MTKPLVRRAMLVGAYRRRADFVHRGHPTDEADVRIAELAELLDISVSRVSQIRIEAFDRMRATAA